jgi:hypothetical protein
VDKPQMRLDPSRNFHSRGDFNTEPFFWVRHEQANFFNSRGTRCHYQLNADYECIRKTAMQ